MIALSFEPSQVTLPHRVLVIACFKWSFEKKSITNYIVEHSMTKSTRNSLKKRGEWLMLFMLQNSCQITITTFSYKKDTFYFQTSATFHAAFCLLDMLGTHLDADNFHGLVHDFIKKTSKKRFRRMKTILMKTFSFLYFFTKRLMASSQKSCQRIAPNTTQRKHNFQQGSVRGRFGSLLVTLASKVQRFVTSFSLIPGRSENNDLTATQSESVGTMIIIMR